MSRDKSLTNAMIIRCMREEFLVYGYEKASLNRISSRVGITTAALYRHFRNKADMFSFLVRDTMRDIQEFMNGSVREMENVPDYDPFDSDWASFWLDFIYEHYDGIKLLICCSKGTEYENFEEKLIECEALEDKRYAEILREGGHSPVQLSDIQWHMLATAYSHLIFEVVRHDMTRAEAAKHLRFVGDLLFPGWKKIYGLD